jgi:predicted DsbA family dithiol-disulfide isomerase
MNNIKFAISFVICLLIFSSCSNNKQREDIVICNIDSIPIFSSELDAIIRQEVYDQLYHIYELKNTALNHLIGYKLITNEAKKYGKEYHEYLEDYTNEMIIEIGLDSLCKKFSINDKITQFRGTLAYSIDSDSYAGKLYIEKSLPQYIRKELIDSLMKVSNIEKFIYPPRNPFINIDELNVYYRGNLKSNTEMIVISDFDCDKCISAHLMYDSIYQKYKNNVKFGYIHFSSIPTLSQIASDAAYKQNMFWQYYDSLYNSERHIDSAKIYSIAQNLSLDINKFKEDISSQETSDKIEETIHKLVNLGLFATPSILINNRLIYNSTNINEIIHLLDEQLSNK